MAISTDEMSSWVGAGIRIPKQRDRNGSMTLEQELQMRIMRHCEEYFSMVRRRPACACLHQARTARKCQIERWGVRIATMNDKDR